MASDMYVKIVGRAVIDFLSRARGLNHTFQITPHADGRQKALFKYEQTDGPVRRIEMLEIELPKVKEERKETG